MHSRKGPKDYSFLVGLFFVFIPLLFLYSWNLAYLSIRGEETRWARIADEMELTGNWIVPCNQGIPFLSRPPLGSWLMILTKKLTGLDGAFAIRFPSVLATAVTAFALFLLVRPYLTLSTALLTGWIFGTMGHVLQFGRLGETDAVFTCFISLSLFAWFWLHTRDCESSGTKWIVGGILAGLAALTKGIQAPVYFFLPTLVFLVVQSKFRMRELFGLQLGLAAFVLTILPWQLEFFSQMGWAGTREIWGWEVSMRLTARGWAPFLGHLIQLPAEIIANTLPHSLLLGLLLLTSIRADLRTRNPIIGFALIVLLVTFPSVWLPTTARGRYYMPLYPFIALLCGCIAEAWRTRLLHERQLMVLLQWFYPLTRYAILLVAAAVAIASILDVQKPIPLAIPPITLLLGFAISCLLLAVMSTAPKGPHAITRLCFVIAASGVLTINGYVQTIFQNRHEPFPENLANVRREYSLDGQLISYGKLYHLMLYHFHDPIPVVPWPTHPGELPPTPYFCFHQAGDHGPNLPFAWERIAVLSCDRHRRNNPFDKIVIGRPITQRASTATATSRR